MDVMLFRPNMPHVGQSRLRALLVPRQHYRDGVVGYDLAPSCQANHLLLNPMSKR
jgi:hypothetical protein